MKKLKFFKLFLSVAFIIIFQYSCNKDDEVFINQTQNFVSFQEANKAASNFENPFFSTYLKSVKKVTKKVKNTIDVKDDSNHSVFYIINYEESGFVIISADNRLFPILAFSESNNFNDDGVYPEGLDNWLIATKNKIKEIRKSNAAQNKAVKLSWDELVGRTAPPPDDGGGDGDDGGDVDPDDCEAIHTHLEPLLYTEWWQGGGFNDSIPIGGCALGEQARVGCGAVAIAQVMNFYEFPNNYNWDNMPNFVASSETARLMKNIGYSVDMVWGCEGSSTDILKMESALRTDFGYTTATAAPYNRYTVENELKNGRPVILTGQGTGGHAWVCDGYVRSYYCNGTSYLVFHMNWGWEEGVFNGYYTYSDWTPGDHDYNYSRGMITNINP